MRGTLVRVAEKAKEKRIKQHPKAASDARSMKRIAEWVRKYTDIKPTVIFEIGANYAQDAEGLRYYFNLKPDNIWVFEAHPDIHREVEKLYDFHAFNVAVYDKEDEMRFNVVDINATSNSGISSLYNHKFSNEKTKEITVKPVRMDNFMKEHKVSHVDVLKLDVEGCNYEVLKSFGERISDVKVIHIEAEHVPLWDNQKLYADMESLLRKHGFELAFFERYFTQSDSLWVQGKFFKNEYEAADAA